MYLSMSEYGTTLKKEGTMKVDPFELHPAIEIVKGSQNSKAITKGAVFKIIKEISEKVEQMPQKTWGYERDDILEALSEVQERVSAAPAHGTIE
jgi:hypothetical protein